MTEKVGIFIVATGKYICFLDALIPSVRKYFTPEKQVHIFLFTNTAHPKYADDADITLCATPCEKWPFPTLNRFKYFNSHREKWENMDNLYYIDADSQIIQNITYSSVDYNLVGAIHPGFPEGNGTPERRVESQAYISNHTKNIYYMWGFFGGRIQYFSRMCRALEGAIQKDLENNIIALWHDESHLNKYFLSHAPYTLDSTFSDYNNTQPPSQYTKILLITKNSKALRSRFWFLYTWQDFYCIKKLKSKILQLRKRYRKF